jgi:hypothetical protein
MKYDRDFYDVEVAGVWLHGICQWIAGGWCSGEGPHKGPQEENGVSHTMPTVKRGESGALREAEAAMVGIAHQIPALNKSEGVHRPIPHLSSPGMGIHGGGVHHKVPSIADGGSGVHAPMNPGTFGQRAEGLLASGACEARYAYLVQIMQALSDRLRNVRITCGDWARITGPSPTIHNGVTGVFLDPPYSPDEYCGRLYAHESSVAKDVRQWCLENGGNPMLRIALCGYWGEHRMPRDWKVFRWSASGGYGNQGQGRGRENRHRETIWFSPHCLDPSAGLFDGDSESGLEPLPEEEVEEMNAALEPEAAPEEPAVPWWLSMTTDDTEEIS